MIDKAEIEKRVRAEIIVQLSAEPELESPEAYRLQLDGAAPSAEDKRNSARFCRAVRRLASTSEWGWCCARVTVVWRDLAATDYLGACSYESEEAFRAGGYYADMVQACVDEIVARVAHVLDAFDLARRMEAYSTPPEKVMSMLAEARDV